MLEWFRPAGASGDVSTLCVHRSCCGARRFIERAGGGHDSDAGMSRHGDPERREDTAAFNGGHRQLHGPDGSGVRLPDRTAMDDVVVTFARSTQPTIDGTLDRVTGELRATFVMLSTKNNKVLLTNYYLLKCAPAQRMF